MQSLAPGTENFRSAACHIGADILLTGTIEKRNDSYVLQITPVRVPDGIVLATHSQTIVASDFLDGFVTPFPADVAHADNKHKADMERITMPSCVHCPDPSYNDLARRNKINGVSVLEVLISPAEVAQKIRPVRLLGYGLDEQAYDVIKTWRFKAATLKADGRPVPAIAGLTTEAIAAVQSWKFRPAQKDGMPVPVRVPVELTFRLFLGDHWG